MRLDRVSAALALAAGSVLVLLSAVLSTLGAASGAGWGPTTALLVTQLSVVAAGGALVCLLARAIPVVAPPPSATRAVAAGRLRPPPRSVDPDRPRGSRPRAPGRRPA